MLRIEERGEHQDFPPKSFCPIVPNISWGNHFVQCFRSFPVAKKFLDKGGGDIKTFRRNFFLSHCRKISYGNHFEQCFRIFSVAKKFMDKGRGRGIKIFRRKNFLHSAEKSCRATLLCSVSEICR